MNAQGRASLASSHCSEVRQLRYDAVMERSSRTLRNRSKDLESKHFPRVFAAMHKILAHKRASFLALQPHRL
jgi:hypothetical protein